MFTRNLLIVVVLSAAAAILTACGGGEQRQVIQNKGSDTLVNVAQASSNNVDSDPANNRAV